MPSLPTSTLPMRTVDPAAVQAMIQAVGEVVHKDMNPDEAYKMYLELKEKE